jgi:hypothetical protein
MVTVQGITQCIHSIAVPTVCNANVQGITQCIHYIAVPTLCNGNGSGYYTMYPLYCCAYTMQ